jgi:hypothetical protein
MSNLTSQFSPSTPATNATPSIGHGGMAHPHIPFSFVVSHIPQMTPTVGIEPPFHPRSNPSLNAPGWSGQLGEQDHAYVLSFTPTPSTSILTKMFGMMNPPLSSGFPPREVQFHTLGNPQPRATPAGGIFTTLIIKVLLEWCPTNPL